jgi:hypothetical protein
VAEFSITVELAGTDGEDGSTHTYAGADHIGPKPLANRFTQLVIPGDDFAGRTVAAVEVEVSEGAVFIDDLRLK